MSTLQKVFSDSAFSAFRYLVSIARGIVIIPLITNLLGAEGYGVWVTIFAIIKLCSSAGGMHLHGSLVRYVSRAEDQNQVYVDILFLAVVLSGLLAGLVVAASSLVDLSRLFEGAVTEQFRLAVVAALLIGSTLLLDININFPRARGDITLFDLLKLCRDALEIGVLAAVFLLGGGILAGMAALLGLSVLLNVALVSVVVVRFQLPVPDVSNCYRYIRYGVPMVPKELSSSLLAHSDKYLLLYFIGPATVGVYAVAQAICRPLVSFTGIFNPTLYPTIAQAWDDGDFDEIATIYRSIFRFYSIVGIPATVGVVVVAEPLLTLLSTPEIAREAFLLVPIFITGYFLRGYDNTLEYILTAADRTEVIGGAVTVTVPLNIVLNVLLIPRLGTAGAALATLVSNVVIFGTLLHYSYAQLPFPIPLATVGRSVVAALTMGLLLWSVGPELGPYGTLLTYPVAGAVIHFTTLLLTGEFSGTELSRAKRGLRDALT
jgi:O-antigen/teichoic acid export membrane protein